MKFSSNIHCIISIMCEILQKFEKHCQDNNKYHKWFSAIHMSHAQMLGLFD